MATQQEVCPVCGTRLNYVRILESFVCLDCAQKHQDTSAKQTADDDRQWREYAGGYVLSANEADAIILKAHKSKGSLYALIATYRADMADALLAEQKRRGR